MIATIVDLAEHRRAREHLPVEASHDERWYYLVYRRGDRWGYVLVDVDEPHSWFAKAIHLSEDGARANAELWIADRRRARK
jgi:hypothetical protein